MFCFCLEKKRDIRNITKAQALIFLVFTLMLMH